jgi:aquaporin NIP
MLTTYLRHAYSEFIGTFLLVSAIAGATMIAYSNGGGFLDVAVAGGSAVALLTTIFAANGAQFNPALTIGLVFTRRIALPMAGVHIAAQIVGALAAGYLLKVIYPQVIYDGIRGGGTSISVEVSTVMAWGLELFAGFLLMTAYYASMVDTKTPRLAGLPVGFAVAVNLLMMGPLTGAGMNPARSIGPAVATGIFEGLAIYVIAPVIGALVAAVAYENLALDRSAESPAP